MEPVRVNVLAAKLKRETLDLVDLNCAANNRATNQPNSKKHVSSWMTKSWYWLCLRQMVRITQLLDIQPICFIHRSISWHVAEALGTAT